MVIFNLLHNNPLCSHVALYTNIYSCKRTLKFAIHVAEDLCLPVSHRQFVWTIPKRLRVYFRFDRIMKLTDTDHVVYKAEHKNCRKFPKASLHIRIMS